MASDVNKPSKKMSHIKSLNQKLPLIFTSYFGNRNCMSCPSLPLCAHFSYKEIAIIQLFYQQMVQNYKKFFSLPEFHDLFLRYYVYERDSYTNFYTIINYLTADEGILLKIDLSKPKNTFVQEFFLYPDINEYKKNSVLYSLNPVYSSQLIDFRHKKNICPIGMNPMAYQILELLIQKDGQTINQIKKKISKDILKNSNTKQTFRRIINEMCAINVIFPEKTNDTGELEIKYFLNQAHHLLSKNYLS